MAVAALKLLHHNEPQGPWRYEDLPGLEQTDKGGHHICEAGCYQCLLSYFNQPDHDHIDRHNETALKLLVALANAQVLPAAVSSPAMPSTLAANPEASSGGALDTWLHALQSGGHQLPDQTAVPVAEGTAIAAGLYKQARLVVFLEQPTDPVIQAIRDKGRDVLVMSAPAEWPAQFAAHPQAFGAGTPNP